MKFRTIWLCTVGVASLAACNKRGNEAQAPTEEATPAGEAMASPTGVAPTPTGTEVSVTPMTAQSFADAAAASDTFELESSRLAETRAKGDKVKQFARMMITDHTKSSKDLKTAAGQATPAVTPATAMTAEQRSNLDLLKAAGTNFDQIYAQQQVAAHEKALSMLQSYASGGDSAPLKDFASKTATAVTKHLDQARSLP